MNNGSMRIALIGPRFFSYLSALQEEFSKRDIEAAAFSDLHSQNLFWRIAYRLRWRWLYRRPLEKRNRLLLDQLLAQDFNKVLLVNCEAMDLEFIRSCTRNGIEVSAYFWDAIANKPIFKSYIDSVDRIASFDPDDCAQYGFRYIPLFAERIFFSDEHRPKREFDIAFVATVHSGRAYWIRELLALEVRHAAKVSIFAYYTSKTIYVLRNLLSWPALTLLGAISTSSMKKPEVASIFQNSVSVLDVHHNLQKGLTSRTFEALAAGAHLITTNAYAANLPGALAERVTFVERPADLAGALQASPVTKMLSAEESYFLSIERFVDNIIALCERQD